MPQACVPHALVTSPPNPTPPRNHPALQVAPQEHTSRGVPFEIVLKGMRRAMDEVAIGSCIIAMMCRDYLLADSAAALEEITALRHYGASGTRRRGRARQEGCCRTCQPSLLVAAQASSPLAWLRPSWGIPLRASKI